MAAFWRRKAQRLARADGSRKGALDERAAAVVRLLNGRAPFCTTSSCSGRLVLAQGSAAGRFFIQAQDRASPICRDRLIDSLRHQDTSGCGIHKKNCTWLMVTHETCIKDDVMTALEKATGDVVLKFEPFVLHVLCQELQDAQLLAVRSTHCLEVPLSHKGKLMVSEEYIDFLIHVANQKMEENIRRIDRFYKRLEVALKPAISTNSSPSEEMESRSRYLHRRKRRTVQEQDPHTSPKDHREELEHEGDTESSLGVFAEMMI
ncbi:tRNA wybutosine-synthesizing protein 3 homolog isoform X2 [Strix aluco]|uniref:tRNA wybutosine-synthesizing protein 3 homolog isoform X2 n=1 Tax=Strix aluco TaxID=111821 RepID=UPI003DA5C15D